MFEYTKNVITRIQKSKDKLETMQENQAFAIKQQEEYTTDLAVYQAEFEGYLEKTKKVLSSLKNDIDQAEAVQKAREKEEQDILNALKKYNDDLVAKQEARKSVEGPFGWPTDLTKSKPVSSGFGRRQNPVTKVWEDHLGIDIPANYGSDIYAVHDGKVIMAVISSKGYGNYIMIDHGGGISTMYAHNSKNLKKVGDTVKKGDVIAYIGSTGLSTGNHLHFGFIVNGSYVNPLAPDRLISPWK